MVGGGRGQRQGEEPAHERFSGMTRNWDISQCGRSLQASEQLR